MFLNGNYIGKSIPELVNFTFVGYTTGSNSNNCWVSSTAQAGDLLLLFDSVNDYSHLMCPNGWCMIGNPSQDVTTGHSAAAAYKIADPSDPNSTVYSPSTATTDHFMLCAIYRANIKLNTADIQIRDLETWSTSNDPAAITTSSSSGNVPLIVFHAWLQRGSNNSWASGTVPNIYDIESTTYDESSRGVIRLWHKIFNAGDTPQDMTSDMSDSGAQIHFGFYIEITKTSEHGMWYSTDSYINNKPNIELVYNQETPGNDGLSYTITSIPVSKSGVYAVMALTESEHSPVELVDATIAGNPARVYSTELQWSQIETTTVVFASTYVDISTLPTSTFDVTLIYNRVYNSDNIKRLYLSVWNITNVKNREAYFVSSKNGHDTTLTSSVYDASGLYTNSVGMMGGCFGRTSNSVSFSSNIIEKYQGDSSEGYTSYAIGMVPNTSTQDQFTINFLTSDTYYTALALWR